jgi:hypothetical protein
MKTAIALLKWLFGPKPESSATSAKKSYVCGWQRAHHRKPLPHHVGRVPTQTPVEMRAEDLQRGLPWFPEDNNQH